MIMRLGCSYEKIQRQPDNAYGGHNAVSMLARVWFYYSNVDI